MKVTFVHTPNLAFADTQMFGIHLMPVWAYTLAAHCAADDVAVSLVDGRFEALESVPAADVFCFSGINQDHDAIIAAHRVLSARHPTARTIVGGPICWSYHTAGRLEALAAFDHIVVGDGEEALPALLDTIRRGEPAPHLVEVAERFPLGRALPMHGELLAASMGRYYGAVVEVSRGCPFLCEFCDIRILPDNNRAHVKDPALIVGELDRLHDLGVRQVLFACDNFIGDLRWAEAVADAILAWQARTGKGVSVYTWLTVNLAKHERLLTKLRQCGFDMLFVGVESFSQSSLLETAKVQNTALELTRALRTIQSFGFVVVAGLIFGFDTDPPDVVEHTLAGILEAGLISGDPSLLTALPGTPLYRRMQLSGRLRDTKLGLGGYKYQTNIRYLKPAATVRGDFRTFVARLNRGGYQLARLRRFYDGLATESYVPPRTEGFADMRRLVTLALRNRRATILAARRVLHLLRAPARALFVARAVALTWRRSTRERPLWFYLKFWLINWSNTVLKYGALTDADFDVASVDDAMSLALVLPDQYSTVHDEPIPSEKSAAQRRVTIAALRAFVARSERGTASRSLPILPE